jgi:hypothetical protein
LRGLNRCELLERIGQNPKNIENKIRQSLLIDADPYADISAILDGEWRNTQKKLVDKQTDPYEIHEGPNTCVTCNALFATKQALAAHVSRKHGAKSEAVRWCCSVVCWGCGLDFDSYERILQHLNRRAKCLDSIKKLNLTFDESKVTELRDQSIEATRKHCKNGRRAHFAKKACYRIIGPILRD